MSGVMDELAVCEEPRSRIAVHGAKALSDVELLALVLAGPGESSAKMVAKARRLLIAERSLPELAVVSAGNSGAPLPGLTGTQTARLAAVVELARRLAMGQRSESPRLERPGAVFGYMQPIIAELAVEKFWVLCLNRRHGLMRCVELTSGTAHATLAHPREVFRIAVREGASAIVCVHNHPSGDPCPSAQDRNITYQLVAAAKAIDIGLLDHVILGRPQDDPTGNGYFSFRDAGLT